MTTIDKLTYGYEGGSNKLSTVRDGSGNLAGFKQVNTSGADYSYDSYGNLEVDRHKRINKIKYNHLHLPVEINFGSDKIEYIYTSSGEKVQKLVIDKGVVTKTDYLGGFQYVGGKLSFFPTAEGFYNVDDKAYVYQYKDHLGNVRLSYSDKNKNNSIESNEIIEETNYYPFGLAHSGYNEKSDNLMKGYRYQYNAKEKQEEHGLNYYDYGARNYDAAIGRWMNVDPLAETMTRHSPYAYVFNNPMMFTDPTGMYGESFQTKYVNDRGDLLFETNDGSNAVVTVPQNKIGRFFNAIDATQDKELLNSEEWNFAMKAWIVGSWNRTMENTQSWYATEAARRNAALYWQTGNIDYWSEAVSEHTGELRSDITAWALGITGGLYGINVAGAKVDLMGGKKGAWGYKNFDFQASSGIADDVANFGKYFGNGSVSEMIVNNPMSSFLNEITPAMQRGGILTIRGQFSNKNFSSIWDTPNISGFKTISKTKGLSSSGYSQTNGTPIKGLMNEIILKKK